MPRYFFSSVDGARDTDPSGVELADDQAAHAYALRFAGEVLASEPSLVWEHGQWRVEVLDEEDTLLFTVVVAIDAPRRNERRRATEADHE